MRRLICDWCHNRKRGEAMRARKWGPMYADRGCYLERYVGEFETDGVLLSVLCGNFQTRAQAGHIQWMEDVQDGKIKGPDGRVLGPSRAEVDAMCRPPKRPEAPMRLWAMREVKPSKCAECGMTIDPAPRMVDLCVACRIIEQLQIAELGKVVVPARVWVRGKRRGGKLTPGEHVTVWCVYPGILRAVNEKTSRVAVFHAWPGSRVAATKDLTIRNDDPRLYRRKREVWQDEVGSADCGDPGEVQGG